MRSAFLSHGAEIINNAFWKRWICKSELCPLKERGHTGEIHACALIIRMVERGVWFLRMAGEGMEHFRASLEEGIKEEQEKKRQMGRFCLIDLFGWVRGDGG